MKEDISSKVNSILSGLNAKDLQTLMQLTKNSNIVNKLSQNDKQKLIDKFSNMNTEDIKRKLSSLNTNELSKLSADDLLKKLNER